MQRVPASADPLRLGRTFSRVSGPAPGDGFRLSGAGMTEEEGTGATKGESAGARDVSRQVLDPSRSLGMTVEERDDTRKGRDDMGRG